MIYTFNILSADSEDFFIQIKTDADNNLFDIHNILQEELKYDKSQMASFFLSDESWEQKQEFPLIDMQTNENVMQKTKISDIVKTKNDKLLYVFDLFSNRGLYISLLDIDENKKLDKPVCVELKGQIPEQIIIQDSSLGFEDFLDDEDFDDEFNDQQFENLDDYDF